MDLSNDTASSHVVKEESYCLYCSWEKFASSEIAKVSITASGEQINFYRKYRGVQRSREGQGMVHSKAMNIT